MPATKPSKPGLYLNTIEGRKVSEWAVVEWGPEIVPPDAS